jgi:hypothetical protein
VGKKTRRIIATAFRPWIMGRNQLRVDYTWWKKGTSIPTRMMPFVSMRGAMRHKKRTPARRRPLAGIDPRAEARGN